MMSSRHNAFPGNLSSDAKIIRVAGLLMKGTSTIDSRHQIDNRPSPLVNIALAKNYFSLHSFRIQFPRARTNASHGDEVTPEHGVPQPLLDQRGSSLSSKCLQQNGGNTFVASTSYTRSSSLQGSPDITAHITHCVMARNGVCCSDYYAWWHSKCLDPMSVRQTSTTRSLWLKVSAPVAMRPKLGLMDGDLTLTPPNQSAYIGFIDMQQSYYTHYPPTGRGEL
ncbi:hypothetical protein BGZ60DRAFT_515867 [Tricladium varicosporioides]|nr:hypothetical protein BGZ60DRAFT_515867 [Hymenoscyphus varicosporioides]